MQGLRRADLSPKESYQLSVTFTVFRIILKWEQTTRPNLSKEEDMFIGSLLMLVRVVFPSVAGVTSSKKNLGST
jgi:hypothetical protein